MQEIELLNHIHQNADMGQDSINHIISLSDDADFLHALNRQLNEYKTAYDISTRMLQERNAQEEDATTMSKVMSHVTSSMKNLVDSSTSKLAEMIIQGSTMGITQLTKQVNAYTGSDKEVIDFANKQLKIEQENIETMKKFL